MPPLWNIPWVIQDEETLEQGATNKAGLCDESLPSNDTKPTGQVAQEFTTPGWRENRNPIEWATSEWDPNKWSTPIFATVLTNLSASINDLCCRYRLSRLLSRIALQESTGPSTRILESKGRSQRTLKPFQPLQALGGQLQTMRPDNRKKGPPGHHFVDRTGVSYDVLDSVCDTVREGARGERTLK